MAKSQVTFNKREKEKKRLSKRLEKQLKKEDRKANSSGGGLENMLAFVDENGVISDTPQDPSTKMKIKAENIEVSVPKKEREEVPEFHKGKVEFYNDSKGFGFIKENGTQEKYFFHVNGLIDEVYENDQVEFMVERGLRGLNAVNVKKYKA
jgi:cold shock CspA family protein